MADPLEPPVAGCNQRFDHRIDSFAHRKVGMSDDRGTRPVIAVEPARALCRHAVHEFDLAHGFHRVAAICVVKGTAFHEHGADDVMAAMRVRMQFVEGVVSCPGDGIDEIVSRFGEGRDQGPQIPQMVMRIDDRQIGFKNVFGHRQPLPFCSLQRCKPEVARP